MSNRKLLPRLGAAAAGLFLSLLLLEGGIRLGGYFFQLRQEYRNFRSVRESGNVRILCVGDSTTADGYPEFLEEVLNRRIREKKFSVINRGVVASNSSETLENLPDDIKRFSPDIII